MKFKQYSFKELLSNIVDNRGKTCPTADQGLPLIATNCINNKSLYPVFEKVRYVNVETYKNWFRGHPKPEDIIFVCKGSPGRVAWVKDPVDFCIAQDMVSIRADRTKIDPKYLFALLRSDNVQQKISNMHVGSLIPHFKKGDFGNLYLDIPEDLEYQKMVGEIYFNFSMKIEQNNKINQTLESIAQALFKSWFIDFDPVRAKIAAKQNGADPELAAMCVISGKSEAELKQMPEDDFAELQATAALFPDELVESELGEVPKGWEITNINAVTASIFSGGTPSTKDMTYWNGEIPWLSSGETRNKIIVSTEKSITETAVKKSSTKLAIFGDILIASAGQGHTRGQTSFNAIECYINQSIVALRANDKVSPYWLYYCLEPRYDEMRSLSDSHSSRGSLTTKLLASMPVILPTKELVLSFDKLIKSMLTQQVKNLKETKILKETRDALLPKLLSGEIDVSALQDEVA